MKVAIISASMRKDSQSLKVATWLSDHAKKELKADVELLDLHALSLPMFTLDQQNSEGVDKLLKALEQADSAVFVSPEWNGMMSHGLVNMQHYLGEQLAHKPVMLVGVSAGRGGQYPLMQMRTMGYKNNHYVLSPEALLVQGVNGAFNDDTMSDDAPDISLKKRADYSLKVLAQYADALKVVRESGTIDYENFANGA